MAEGLALAPGTDDATHLIVTLDADGWTAESPQVPGLCFGRPSEDEFRRDYQAVLHDIGVRGTVLAHLQVRSTTPEGQEYLVRWAEGPDRVDRVEVCRRVELVLASDQRRRLMASEPTATGEVVFVAALPNDRLGLFMDQLYDERDALVLCAAVADQGVFTLSLASGKDVEEGWATLAESGWSRDTRVSQLLVDEAAGRRQQRLLV